MQSDTNTSLDFSLFFEKPDYRQWHAEFETALKQRANFKRHGDLQTWLDIMSKLPSLSADHTSFNNDVVTIGEASLIDDTTKQKLHDTLLELLPWRKGPYQIFNTFIDSEWRSDWKWKRIEPHIRDLTGQHVLDVGCGNGYHCWRMLGAGARTVLGIDPSMRFYVQFLAVNRYAKSQQFDFLPIGIEDMPVNMPIFDSVFSMGVLYHRRTPLNHLKELFGLLTSGGQLILETLIVDQAEQGVLVPEDRYAQMRNVWNILTVDKATELLNQAGFKNIECVDQNITSLEEQRRTNWMQFYSLADFLDPDDRNKTVEGHPAPKRGIFVAQKP